MSNWLSYGEESLCLHEPEVNNALEKLYIHPSCSFGASSSGAYLWPEESITQDTRIVYVVRDIDSVFHSFVRFFGDSIDPDAYSTHLVNMDQEIKNFIFRNKNAMIVAFDSLSEMPVLKRIWEYVFPYIRFDENRTLQLINFNVSLHNSLDVFDYKKALETLEQ